MTATKRDAASDRAFAKVAGEVTANGVAERRVCDLVKSVGRKNLGRIVRSTICAEVKRAGLKMYPAQLPRRSKNERVLFYRAGSVVEKIVHAITTRPFGAGESLAAVVEALRIAAAISRSDLHERTAALVEEFDDAEDIHHIVDEQEKKQ